MFGAFDISTSALNAQRLRLDTIASNIANVDTVIGPDGKPAPYRRIFPVFQAQRTAEGGVGVGVKSIEEDQSEFRKEFEPGNPAADSQGWVSYPNVNLSTEYVNALETTRAYEANITAVETTKSMMNSTLHLLA
ncbi:MAG: flagellar basal body rod protein FlgC [Phycisphaerae bacterium]